MRVSIDRSVGKLSANARNVCAIAALAWLVLGGATAHAQRELKVIPDPDPELERASFQVADGLEVNLYAADPLLAKPIHMNFDAAGRLWIASSEVYPQVKPGQTANDKILVLEDADQDGRAEKTTVFADGLLIPTGVEPGDGGAYIANSTELLHLRDTDGDGRADARRVMLSGFGTEDTHHIVHTFRWAPDGMLYFNQSIYIHSHIETPHGVRRLNSGGIWQFRPETMQLEVFARGLCNPWGHIFDRWGQSFATDGAGGEGINYVFPGATMFVYAGATKILQGLNPGSPKHCGLEVISGRHFPDEWQGNLITNDFRAHRVCRFVLTETGSGYSSREQSEIIKTSHAAFRPIDAKMGPDGALYIADWYNPIIQHGEVDFRDERRDHTHGRIWRVTVKGRPLVERPKLVGADVDHLLAALRAPEDFTRLHAKQQLKALGKSVVPQLAAWVKKLDPADSQVQHHRLEALWAYQTLDVVEPALLTEMLQSPDHHARAAATRVLRLWQFKVPHAADLLARLVADPHPQVRLEAVRALAESRTAGAIEVAMRALDAGPIDRFMDHALWLAARDLQPYWQPALEADKLTFGGNLAHLTFVLQAANTPAAVRPLMKLVRSGTLPDDRRASILTLVASLGGPDELRTALDLALDDKTPAGTRLELMAKLTEAARLRKVRPAGDLSALAPLLGADLEPLAVAAIQAAGLWHVDALAERLGQLGAAADTREAARRAALNSLATLGPAGAPALTALCQPGQSPQTRTAAIAALAKLDTPAACQQAIVFLSEEPLVADPAATLLAIIDRKTGAAELTKAIEGKKLPADAAKLAIRAVRSAAREEPALVAALTAAGGISGGPRPLQPAELNAVVADVAAKGNAERGEAIFRRQEQACLKCHSISGAGGRVGPDLVSIGASAQIDYLIESILVPSAKIKENYHSLTVVADGRIFSGVKVRETDSELVLRDVEDRDVSIPLAEIEERAEAGSLMPVGLSDSLTRDELVDLVRFLSELGKEGPYATSKTRVVRRWQALLPSAQASSWLLKQTGSLEGEPDSPWTSVYSRVAGNLPLDGAPALTLKGGKGPVVLLRANLDVATAGKVDLLLSGPVQKAWIDQMPVEVGSKLSADLTTGTHTVTLLVEAKPTESLRLELIDVPGSAAQAQIVGGK